MAQKTPHIAVLVEEQYQVLEVWYPILRLREEGFRVTTIGTGKDSYPSKEGYPVKADMVVDQAKAKDFDAVIIPGGWAPDFLRRSEKMVKFVKDLYDNECVVAAICHGGWLLVSAGIAEGNKVTSFSAIKDDLIAAGGSWIDREVVIDKNLVTSRKPDDLPAFIQAVIKLVKK